MFLEVATFAMGLGLGLYPTFLVIRSLKKAGLYSPEPIPADFRKEVVKLLEAERPKPAPPPALTGPGSPPSGGSGAIKSKTSPEVARLLKVAIENAEDQPYNWAVSSIGSFFNINGTRYTGAKGKDVHILKDLAGNCTINSLTISREDYDKTIAGILEAKMS